MRRLDAFTRRRPNLSLLLLFLTSTLAALVLVATTGLRNDHVLGMVSHAGLHGEMLFQGHMLYNILHGNALTHYETLFIGFPESVIMHMPLAFSFHLYLTAPWTALLGPVGGFNMSAIFFMLLNLFSALLLMRALFSSRRVILFAALLAAWSGYSFLKLKLGFHQKLCLFWMPLYLLALIHLWRTRRTRHALAAALWLLMVELMYPPYALFLALGTVPLPLFALASSRRDALELLGRLAITGAVAVSVTLLVYSLMGYSISDLSLAGLPGPGNLAERSIGVISLLWPFSFDPYVISFYPAGIRVGISLLALALGACAAVRTRGLARVALAGALCYLVLGAGVVLSHGGQAVEIGGRVVPLPFSALTRALPMVDGINMPFRLLPIASLLLAIPAGFGLQRLAGRIPPRARSLLLWLAPALVFGELAVFSQGVLPSTGWDTALPPPIRDVSPEVTQAVLFIPEVSDRKQANFYGFHASLWGVPMVNDYGGPLDEWRTPPPLAKRLNLLHHAGVRRVAIVVSTSHLCPDCVTVPPEVAGWMTQRCHEIIRYPEQGLNICHLGPGQENAGDESPKKDPLAGLHRYRSD